MPECDCGGSNPNCYRCWGRGWVDDSPGTESQKVKGKKTIRNDNTSLRVLKVCHICTLQIDQDLFDSHLKSHCNKPSHKLAKCHKCNSHVRLDRLEKHIAKVHSDKKNKKIVNFEKKLKNNKIIKNKQTCENNYRLLDREISCVNDDKIGDKNLGYLARENGMFGSLPLYDDYSEDSSDD